MVLTPTDDALLRATLRWMRAGHGTPHDDEDLHPSRLDLTERDLELALEQRDAWRERAHGRTTMGARRR